MTLRRLFCCLMAVFAGVVTLLPPHGVLIDALGGFATAIWVYEAVREDCDE